MRSAFETDLAEVCAPRQCNVGLLAYSPLAGGALSGKYIAGGKGHEKSRFNIFPGYMERCVTRACAAATLLLLQAVRRTYAVCLPAEDLCHAVQSSAKPPKTLKTLIHLKPLSSPLSAPTWTLS